MLKIARIPSEFAATASVNRGIRPLMGMVRIKRKGLVVAFYISRSKMHKAGGYGKVS
ncbi:hypothetical protein [Bosea psychrotolerans]|uniref:hypothetical protein n=1 Tax=Bosea psychrotolerans TaxID=1871628 RepID=UPI0015E19EA8|nr:hypothetical protein [Bosea psychrotolerans]